LIVQLYGPLRSATGSGALEVRLGGRRPLRSALSLLPEPVKRQVLDENGEVRPGFLILVNDVDARTLHNFNIDVSDEDRLTILPMIHGGCH